MYEDDEIEDSRLVKDLRKQIKDLSKERDEAKASVTKFETQAKRASVSDLLGSKGVNKGLAKFAIADGVEDEAGLTAWLAENGELFGVKPDEPVETSVEGQDEIERVQAATATGAQAVSALSPELKAADDAQTPEEWKAAVNAAKQAAFAKRG